MVENLVDVADISRKSSYHGLCGITVKEFAESASGQLDPLAQKLYGGQSFLEVLKTKFGPQWGRSQFGFEDNLVNADQTTSELALTLSPLDAWEIVQSLLKGCQTQLSRWVSSLKFELYFTSFSSKYASSPQELIKNANGAWVKLSGQDFAMSRNNYMLLHTDLHVLIALFEIGLLTVTAIDRQNGMAELRPLNATVKEAAEKLLDYELKNEIVFNGFGGANIYAGRLSFKDQTQYHIPPIPEKIEEGDVVVINRNEVDDMGPVPLFIRKHLVDQLSRVELFCADPEAWKLYVTGAPGCGKSCFFWMWACILSRQGKRLLFIQYRQSKACQTWVLQGNERKLLTSITLQQQNIAEVTHSMMEGISQDNKFDVCVCDGVRVTQSGCSALLGVLDAWAGKKAKAVISKLILVTSLQFFVSEGDERTGLKVVKKLSFDSWKMEDYEMAAESTLVKQIGTREMLLGDWEEVKNDTSCDLMPTDQEKALAVMRQKYYYAGGCARFMFDTDLKQLRQILNDLFGRVHKWSMFTKTSIAGNATDAINSLMQKFSDSTGQSLCTPVSKFVLLRAFDECRTKLTTAVEQVAMATNNPSLYGWAFELKQLDLILSALETRRTVKSSKLTFSPKSEASFDGNTIFGKVESGTIIRCSQFNQALCDVALYFDEKLVTLQFTVGDKHSLKLKHMKHLRTALIDAGLRVVSINHLAIIVKDKIAVFEFENATGYEGVITRGVASAKASGSASTFNVIVDTSEELDLLDQVGPDSIQTGCARMCNCKIPCLVTRHVT